MAQAATLLSLSLLRLRTVQVNISVTDEAALAGFLRVLLFSPVSVIPPMLRTYLHPHFALTRRTNGRSLGTFRISEGTEERNAQSDVYSAMVTCAVCTRKASESVKSATGDALCLM